MITGKFPEINTRANETPHEDSNKQPTEKKQDKAPLGPKTGSAADSNKQHKSPKTPLPLPSKK